jgi:hypothetical protein
MMTMMVSRPNDGTAAEKAFEVLIKADDLYRFPDQKALTGLNGGRRIGSFRQPSDYLITKGGVTWYAEVKSCQSAVSFPFADIRPSQSAKALKMAAVRGGYAFYLFSFGLGKWFIMTAGQYADVLKTGAKSVKFSQLSEWNS